MWGDTYSKQFKMIDARLVVALLVVMMVLYDVHLAAQAETSEPSSKVAHRKQELCGNNELKMTKLSQLAQIKTDACGPVVKRAFEEWKKIARDRDNVCTLDYASRLTRFYKTYLANMDSEKEDIPEQLRRFSIAYGMLVSGTCKKQLIFEEFQDRHRLANSYLRAWVGEDGFVNRLLYPLPERAGILLPLDFSAMFPEFKDKYRQVLGLGEQKNRDEIKQQCQHLYPPYLRDLAWAVMHLTRNGLQFEPWELAHELSMSESWRFNLARWKRFIFLCEALEEVQPYIRDSSYNYNSRHKPPAKIPLKGDRIIHWYDYRLESAVNSFNVNEKPENRLKDGLIRQSHWFAIAAADSNDKAAGVLKRAFEILKRPASGDRDKDLLVVKEDLLKLLDSKKRNGTIRKTFNVAHELKYLVRLPVRTVDYLVYYIIRLLQGDRPNIIAFD